ncbi:protein kinase domain-containing protein [Catenuloplanes atrovinosus]|uniref:Serine/threonine protein kinase n=1 Tax=Catenuloplanes atrovinosus TaxID=137266 RepID=A0AAE3YKI2_9ACTN|nr:protein kinase [Catenuloplanes atrovinosus]MDR7274597.1 serine/threonine protein kinase [Catenuloplanes atrovinosus]
MPPERSARTAATALLESITDPGGDQWIHDLEAHRAAVIVRGAALVLGSILDHVNDHELAGRTPGFIESCERAGQRAAARPGDSAQLAAGLLFFISVNVELLRRRFDPPSPAEQRASDDTCRRLIARPQTRRAIHALYAPEGFTRAARPGERPESAIWRHLDVDSMAYFKAGTTSLILTVREQGETGPPAWVLKCVLFPWGNMSAIANATAAYASVYGRAPDPIVRPRASTTRWVLMPRQEGDTLRERIDRCRAAGELDRAGDRIAFARTVAAEIIAALRVVTDARYQHLDLSPSNIILTGTGAVKLIDLGRNHLYSRQVGIAEHDDSVYIAPEVKNRGDSPTSDVYSLGIIVLEILSGGPPRDGRVPDAIYEMSPVLGRAMDDLIEERPAHRLLLMETGTDPVYARLGAFLAEAFSLAEAEPSASPSAAGRAYARFAPASRELLTQVRKWRQARGSPIRHSGYLLFFALLASAVWWFVFTRTAVPQLADVIKEFPRLPKAPTAAAIIAFAQGLVSAKFYQTILARLTARGIPGALPLATEIAMRSMPLLALPTTIVAVGWKPHLWAWSVAAGALLVALTNLLCLLLARRLFASGRGHDLSTVPDPGVPLPRGFEQWWWTMLLYAAILTIIAYGLQVRWLHDETAIVLGLMVINLGIHYISKCALAGPAIRGGLARAFVIGEKVTALTRTPRRRG